MIRERLLGLSDYDFSCTYEILESLMGVSNYVATLKLTPVIDGARCFAEWSAEFDCAEGREAELMQTIGSGAFQAGFDALKRQSAADDDLGPGAARTFVATRRGAARRLTRAAEGCSRHQHRCADLARRGGAPAGGGGRRHRRRRRAAQGHHR